MTKVLRPDIETGAAALAVANTPSYLLRKLQSDPQTIAVAQRHTAADLLNALVESISAPPSNLDDLTWAYMLLVALGKKADPKTLEQIKDLQAPYLRWFDFLKSSLTTRSISTTRLVANMRPTPSFRLYANPQPARLAK